MSNPTKRALTPREIAKKLRPRGKAAKPRDNYYKVFEAGAVVQKMLEKRGYIVRGEKYDNGALLSCRGIKIAVKVRVVSVLASRDALTKSYVFQLDRDLMDTVDIFVCIVGPNRDMYVFPKVLLRSSSITISAKPVFTRYVQCWVEQFRNKVDLLFAAIDGEAIENRVSSFQEGAWALHKKHAKKPTARRR